MVCACGVGLCVSAVCMWCVHEAGDTQRVLHSDAIVVQQHVWVPQCEHIVVGVASALALHHGVPESVTISDNVSKHIQDRVGVGVGQPYSDPEYVEQRQCVAIAIGQRHRISDGEQHDVRVCIWVGGGVGERIVECDRVVEHIAVRNTIAVAEWLGEGVWLWAWAWGRQCVLCAVCCVLCACGMCMWRGTVCMWCVHVVCA